MTCKGGFHMHYAVPASFYAKAIKPLPAVLKPKPYQSHTMECYDGRK